MTWGLVIAGVGAAVGGVAASSASKSAAKTQANSANAATAAQQQMFDKQVELQAPWQQTGQQGLNVLSQYLGLTTPQQAQTQATTPVFVEQAPAAAPTQTGPFAGTISLNGGGGTPPAVRHGLSRRRREHDIVRVPSAVLLLESRPASAMTTAMGMARRLGRTPSLPILLRLPA
jgi:pyruvate/2-oxoglutarate dehydrogenase complex dihydrolipoamide acyltransferase (E2) component